MQIETINYETCPEHLRDGFRRYIEEGVPTGHFLHAVLSNDLMQACTHADETNKTQLYQIVYFIHNQLPYSCYGSTAIVGIWLNHRGLKGKAEGD